MTPVLVLVGPPGSGKTTVGRLVAQRRKVAFRDTDRDVEVAAGRSVSDIFVDDGEPAFRALEAEAVATALADHDGVLAVGGGAVLDSGTRERLRSHRVVFLDVGLTDAVDRVGFAKSRPLLVLNPRAELKRMLDERRPIYLEVADATVITDGRAAADVAEEIAALLERPS
jgi:shikimate kinase